MNIFNNNYNKNLLRKMIDSKILTKDNGKIDVGRIQKAVYEHIYQVNCVDPETKSSEKCRRSEICSTRLIWKQAGENITSYFNSLSISYLSERVMRLGVIKDKKQKFDNISKMDFSLMLKREKY